MISFAITPEGAVNELVQFNQSLADGLQVLGNIGEVTVGASAKEEVYREDKMVLYHFAPRVAKPHPVPLLIVYALVNRPYMADLQEDRSTIRTLLDAGLDIYLIDWGYPDASDRFLGLDDYINGYIHRAVNEIGKRHQLSSINMLGICQGGTFSLCYSAMHPQKVRALVTMVTPIDFHTSGNLLSHWAQKLDVDLLVDTMGNISGDLLNMTFVSMKPFQLTGQKYVDMVSLMTDKEKLTNFLRMEKWINDSPNQAGEAFREFIKNFYQRNALVKGDLEIGNHPVRLENLSMPLLNVYATEDHLVPPDSSKALRRFVTDRDYTELAFKGGHIGIYVGSRAQKEVPPSIARWLREKN
ncbi:MAG: class III poly(R)-hydroxyalkanoic acid synthase subunit PhaC [Magnetococcales bacterium]|nr:class III poly(R)-hydroxyalkanoic acid synthase subunit PhaC [Magnetococcales bacterium]